MINMLSALWDLLRTSVICLVKGIVAMLLYVLSGSTPKEILETELYFIERIGLQEHLSPTRSNGVVAMLKQLRLYALAYNS